MISCNLGSGGDVVVNVNDDTTNEIIKIIKS
jgi:hypothetical protein